MTSSLGVTPQADEEITGRQPDHRLRPPAFRRVAWVAWRQQRTALAGLVLLAAGVSAFLVVTGLSVRAAIAAIGRAHCQLTPSICFPLYQKAGSWTGIYGPQWTLALPVVAAVFIGAPMIARGYETGSLRFALTQGVRRARWAVPQFLVAAAAGMVACVVAALIGTWWLDLYHGPYILAPWRWDTILFNITPVMLPCWLLLGISIGALAAVTIRRIVPAMAATLASAVALAIAADRLRLLPNALLAFGAHTARQSGALWTVCSSSGCIFGDPAGQAYRGGIIAKGWFTHAGQRLTASQAADLAARIPHNGMNAPSAAYLGRWLASRHYTYWISFQPDSTTGSFRARTPHSSSRLRSPSPHSPSGSCVAARCEGDPA